jgi:hypothetical protein
MTETPVMVRLVAVKKQSAASARKRGLLTRLPISVSGSLTNAQLVEYSALQSKIRYSRRLHKLNY